MPLIKMVLKKQEVLDLSQSLLEMYKAGFLDAYKLKNRVRKKADWKDLNIFYKLAFNKRFGKKITKILKEKK